MSKRQLILLSPYRLPTETTLYLGDEEVAAILEGHQALWHPAVLRLGSGLPRLAQPYDHEEPQGDALYVLPDNPPLMLPEDWRERARSAGALLLDSTHDRAVTRENLLALLREAHPEDEEILRLVDLTEEKVRPFLGIGFGVLILDALFEAMSHENTVARPEIRQDLDEALHHLHADDPSLWRQPLVSAAERLLSAREVLYPVTLYQVDLMLVDDERPDEGWPLALRAGQPLNVIACGQIIDQMAQHHPGRLVDLREKIAAGQAEILGGVYREREDPLLPLETQLWNLQRGQAAYLEHLGCETRVFARKRYGFHPQTPLLLQNVGITHALLLSFDDGLVPSHHSIVVSWPSHDGKQVDCFTRSAQPTASPQTYFHLAHYLHQTIMQDQSATFVQLHRGGKPAFSIYGDWVELTEMAPVLGRWVTLTSYFNEVVPGDYTSAASPDEFQADYLSDRTLSEMPKRQQPISEFAEQVRGRRKLDAAWTFYSIGRTLGTAPDSVDGLSFPAALSKLENRFESTGEVDQSDLQLAMQRAAESLGRRLVARGPVDSPGWLVLNPCSFTRRVALELPGVDALISTGGPVKASQLDGDLGRVVVEVPPLGFAWVPKGPSVAAPPARMRLADPHAVRNEFFEAEIDPQTGGLRAFRDQRQRITRLAQQLVYNPGASMRASRIEMTCCGPALGEVVAHGALVDESGTELAHFRQRYRAWLGRPILELRVEIEPVRPVEGYAWHAYYAARFAWREEMTSLIRSVTGLRSLTSQNRPETPDYLELRNDRRNTVIFPGGLPFHQRHGTRMLDVLLVCEGERSTTFDLGISLDRESPMQTALGLISPVAVVPTTQGPPHVGAAGWLYHMDAANVLLTSLRPAIDHPDGIVATLLECTGTGGPAQFRCLRDPVRAIVQDLRGTPMIESPIQGDAVDLEVSANDLLQLRVEFS